jgi:hypothetical protein
VCVCVCVCVRCVCVFVRVCVEVDLSEKNFFLKFFYLGTKNQDLAVFCTLTTLVPLLHRYINIIIFISGTVVSLPFPKCSTHILLED